MKIKFEPLTIVLLAAAFGLAFLPILIAVGANPTAIGGLGGVYGVVVTIVAPLVARRQRDDSPEPDARKDRDG